MSKPKIYASGNETLKGEFNVSYYIFQKDESFLDWLAKLLIEVIEIEDGEWQAKFIIDREEDAQGGLVEKGIYQKNVNKMVDVHEKYFNKGQRVDVFYGKERVYVTLRKSREIRKKFAQFVLKTKEWIAAKQVQELPAYAGKKIDRQDLR
jgi:hypothetical protein